MVQRRRNQRTEVDPQASGTSTHDTGCTEETLHQDHLYQTGPVLPKCCRIPRMHETDRPCNMDSDRRKIRPFNSKRSCFRQHEIDYRIAGSRPNRRTHQACEHLQDTNRTTACRIKHDAFLLSGRTGGRNRSQVNYQKK